MTTQTFCNSETEILKTYKVIALLNSATKSRYTIDVAEEDNILSTMRTALASAKENDTKVSLFCVKQEGLSEKHKKKMKHYSYSENILLYFRSEDRKMTVNFAYGRYTLYKENKDGSITEGYYLTFERAFKDLEKMIIDFF